MARIPAKKLIKLTARLTIALVATAMGMLIFSNGRVGVSDDLASSALLKTPSAPLSGPVTLKVATFNIHDLYVVSTDRPQRMRAIGAKLMILDPDIVGFQEAFIASDRAILMKELESTRLKHFQYYPSGTVGSGLLIASAFPIKEIYFHRFTVANPFYKIWEGDWWAGKGVALARLELPEGCIDFYNTHAQAGYGNPAYDLVRNEQMAELATFIRQSHCGAPALLAGDMNCRVGDTEYDTAVNGAELERVMAIESRIDHIFSRKSAPYSVEVVRTEPIEAVVKLGEKELSLSDHPGYMSTLTIRPGGTNTTKE